MINIDDNLKAPVDLENKLKITYNTPSEYLIDEDSLDCLQEFIVKIVQIGLGEDGPYKAALGGC